MKLGKEEILKIGLGVVLLIGVVYCYFDLLLGPLHRKQDAALKSIQTVNPKIEAARVIIAQSVAAKQNEPASRMALAQIDAMIPSGAPVAWFPPRVADFFKAHAVDKASVRFLSETPEKTLPDFRRMVWSLEFAKTDFVPFAIALAEFENAEPLVEVANVLIESNRDAVDTQRIVVTLNNLVKK